MKEIADLVKGDKIKIEIGDFDIFVIMEVDKVDGSKVYGTIMETMTTLVKVGDYERYDFGFQKRVEVV